jgi:hypothetical protein
VKASVFIGTSLDGFIARATGDLDFLPPGGGEPHGYDEFIATVDALVIGRKTFEKEGLMDLLKWTLVTVSALAGGHDHMRALRHWSLARVLIVSTTWFFVSLAVWLMFTFRGWADLSDGGGSIGFVMIDINPIMLLIPVLPAVMLILAWSLARRKHA